MNVTSPGGNTLTVNPVGKPRQEILQVPPVTVTATVAEVRQQPIAPIQIQVSWGDITGKPAFGTASLRDAAQPNATAGPGEVVLGSDPRMTNARVPLSHTHTAGQISDSSLIGRSILTASDGPAVLALIGIPGFANPLPVANGGTGAATLAGAQTNLAIPTTAADLNSLGGLIKAGGDMTGRLGLAAPVSIASAASLNLGNAGSNFVTLTGTTGVTGIVAPAGRFFWVTVNSGLGTDPAVVFTNSANLACPRGVNYNAADGDVLFIFMTAANVARLTVANRAKDFVRRSGDQMAGALDPAAEVTAPSAATVDLNNVNGSDVVVTGSTNISSFGTAAPIGTTRNLRFAAANALVCGNSSTAGSIAPFPGSTPASGGLFRVVAGDIVTVKKYDNGVWYICNVSNMDCSNQVWEKFADWVPTAVNNMSWVWDVNRYRRIRVSIVGVKMASAGNAADDLYMRVYQNSVLKSGGSDYYEHAVYWYGTAGVVVDSVYPYMRLTYGGQGSTPEEMHGEVFVDSPGAQRGGVFGVTRNLTNGSLRNVNLLGHQVLVLDAQINGVLIGFANGGNFTSGTGSIVLEGLRR